MVHIGIIGAGRFAAAHIDALAALRDRARVVAYTRRDLGKPFPAAESAGIAAMTAQDLLRASDIDAILIGTPNHLHRAVAKAAFSESKHVFCEKPLAMTVEDADAVIRAAQAAGRVLMVGHLTRHVPVYATVGEFLQSGEIGAPCSMYAHRMHVGPARSWRMDATEGGGAVFDLLVHDFDLMNWYLGVPGSVVARGYCHEQGGLAYAAALFSYDDRRTAAIEGGFVLRPPAGLRAALHVVGDRGHIEIDMTNAAVPIRLFRENRVAEEIRAPIENMLVKNLASEWNEFLDTVEGAPLRKLHPKDARNAVACAAAVIEAVQSAQEIRIPH